MSKQIHPGMSIISVNGNQIAGLTKKQCMLLLRKSPKEMTIVLERPETL
jgi:C-terminal processing protease CtpA/Prc